MEPIVAADYANRFGWLQIAKVVDEFNGRFPPVAVYRAMVDGLYIMMWPRAPTPCMYGYRTGVNGIVINSLYDGATPYVNAITMRAGMSNLNLVTWQGIGHCVQDARTYDPLGVEACNEKVDKYLMDGQLPPDGFTCRNSLEILAEQEQLRAEHRARMAARATEL